MDQKTVNARVRTHYPVTEDQEVVDSAELENSQAGMLLIDPEDLSDDVSTHSDDDLEFEGSTKAPVTAAKQTPVKAAPAKSPKHVKADAGEGQQPVDEDLPAGGSVKVPNEVDPAEGYLEQPIGELPVIESASDDDEFPEDADMVSADNEFDDLPMLDASDDEDDEGFDPNSLTLEGADEDEVEDIVEDEPAIETADFENVEEGDEHVPLVDVDATEDTSEGDLVFASIGKALHVIRSNRIIASMGPNAAARADVADVYMLDQFQDVVTATVAKKGLRKGLVQSGFVLAKVKLTSAKATAKVVTAKVEKQVAARLESLSKRDGVMEQSLAIAATGINKHFFTGVQNELKAALEVELETAGVRGGNRMIRAMFAKHGVSYAKAILTLAKKISSMSDEVRDQYVEALDMAGDQDADDGELDDMEDDVDDDFVEPEAPVTARRSVVAALSHPLHRQQTAALRASQQSSEAFQILSGARSLV